MRPSRSSHWPALVMAVPPSLGMLLETLPCPVQRVPHVGMLWHHTETAASWCRWGLVRRTKPGCRLLQGVQRLFCSLSSALGSTGEAAARIWAANANNTDVLTIRLFLQLKTKRSSNPKCEEMSTLKNFSSACLPCNEGLQVCGGRGWVVSARSGA